MIGENCSRTQLKWAYVQFIADVSLNANCRASDLKLALSLIADLADGEYRESEIEIFYEAR